MDQNEYLRQRTDQILRERIALGITAGGARGKRSGSKTVKKRVSAKRRSTKKCSTRKPVARRAHKRLGRPVKASCARRPRKIGGEEEMLDLYDSIYGRGEGVRAGKVSKSSCKKPSIYRRKYERKNGTRVNATCVRSPWIEFVKKVADNLGVSYKEALSEASAMWNVHGKNSKRRGYGY